MANESKIAVVGLGPAGSTMARLIAEAGYQVEAWDARNHIAGNCFDGTDSHGVIVHHYGPHYFRTNSEELLGFLSRFTEWIPGEYYVRCDLKGKLFTFPVGLKTMEELKGKSYTPDQFEAYLKDQRVSFPHPQNAEEQCLSTVGRELYELFFKNYTEKQWGRSARELDPSITARIPLRMNHDPRYPTEKFQFYPRAGYTEMFRQILDHPQIHVQLRTSLSGDEIQIMRHRYKAVIYTGALDDFFNFRFGPLEYRSLRFEWKHFEKGLQQPCVQINYPNEKQITRSVEYRHVTRQTHSGSTISYEYPADSGEKFYPLLNDETQKRYRPYADLARAEEQKDPPIIFLGRLADYRYYNMDHVFLKAIKTARELVSRLK